MADGTAELFALLRIFDRILERAAGHADPAPPPWTIAWLSGLVNRQQGRLEEAEANFRKVLEDRVEEMTARHGDNPPRPPHWGGYRVLPELFEFWQGRPSRLHDRLRYTRVSAESWERERLAP